MRPVPSSVFLRREYELTNDADLDHLRHGRCPEYALDWLNGNLPHWPEGHNYVVGDGVGAASFSFKRKMMQQLPLNLNHLVFCDLDGVLADFDKGVRALGPNAAGTRFLWPAIHRTPAFFEQLEWTAHGRALWAGLQALLGHPPIVLTGSTCEKFSAQKRAWCARELGPDVPVICCRTKDKPLYCVLPQAILIDDRNKVAQEWVQRGGRFLLFRAEEENCVERVLDQCASFIGSVGAES